MKFTLRFFAILDVVCLVLLAEQAQNQFLSFLTNEKLTSLEFFSRALFLLGWLSLFASAILLLLNKKAGLVVYFCQIPLRFMFFIFSFGFISYLTYVISWPAILSLLTPAILFGEFLRIYFSYLIYRKRI